MDDRRTVELFLQRDERAIELVMREYGAGLTRIALGVIGDESIAEECVNDAYLKAWNSIPPHEPYGFLFAYLGRIVRCTALDRMEKERAQKRSAPTTELTREIEQCLPSNADVTDEAEKRELMRVINGFLSSLPEEKRRMFIRRYWFFDPIETVARLSGMSAGGAKMALMRLRRQLARRLKDEGYDVP